MKIKTNALGTFLEPAGFPNSIDMYVLHNDRVYHLDPFRTYTEPSDLILSLREIYESEEAYDNCCKNPTLKQPTLFPVSKSRTWKWKDPTPEEEEVLNTFFEKRHVDYNVEFKNNWKECDEYAHVLDDCHVNKVALTGIDFKNLTYELTCLNCGKKTTFSFTDKRPTCSHCGFQQSSYWYANVIKTDGTKGKFNEGWLMGYNIYDKDCNDHKQVSFRVDSKSHKTVRFEIVDEERINIFGITQKVDVRESKQEIVVSNILNWVASYSWKDGVTARKLYGKGRTKDVSFAELILEVSSLSAGENFRSNTENFFIGSKNASMFILDHSEFLSKIGFLDFLRIHNRSNYWKNYAENNLLKYITLLGEYPVFEQIIKAGHSNIAAAIFEDIQGSNKDGIRMVLQKWSDILDINSTSGTKALKIPKYVSAYLASTNASESDYVFWIQNWHLFGLSKEQFDEFVGDPEFVIAHTEKIIKNHFFLKLLQRGYNPQKLKKYLVKQCDSSASSTLHDYLKMCEESGIDPDPYPYHLNKMHDDVADIYYNINAVYDEEYVKRIQSESRDLVNETRKTLESKKRFPADFKEYTALFPTKKQEFFNEGNAMHSCVGPYMSNVNAGNNIVFFVRQKENTADSYITAEWSKEAGGVGQVLMSNNRECSDEKAYKFATWVANTIQLGVDRGLVSL